MISVIFFCVIFARFGISSPIPTSNSTGEFVAWRSEPNARGTFSLLSSCLITLTLCVWTAVHLNIAVERQPNEHWNIGRKFINSNSVRRLRWVLMGLFAPELVVYAAWRQWSSAKELTQKMQTLLKKNQSGKAANPQDEWTIVHSFYAGMGGFVVDVSRKSYAAEDTWDPTGGEYIPGDRQQLTLTAQGVLFLASSGYILPSISKETILDRSKADGLAKTLVCLQAGYMMVQCATRVASNLPLSFLEINTLGHVICALVMYLFWLHKPQDIRTTTQLSDKSIQPTCAYMYMESSLSRTRDGSPREFSMLRYDHSLGVRLARPQRDFFARPGPTVVSVEEGETLKGTAIGPLPAGFRRMTRAERRRQGGATLQRVPFVRLSSAVELDVVGVQRWYLADEFLRQTKMAVGRSDKVPSTIEFPSQSSQEASPTELEALVDSFKNSVLGVEFFVKEVPNWPHSAGYLSHSFYSTWAAIALAVGFYGGLHVSAWNSHFPTFIERVMWCTSASLVAASGSLALLLILIDRVPFWGQKSYIKWWWEKIHGDDDMGMWLWHTFTVMIVGGMMFCLTVPLALGVVAYVPARLFLVVEAFLSLRDLPAGVYQTPDWTQLIPHL